MCRFGSFIAPILAIGTLVAIGGAGYRAIDGGCPMCHETSTVKTTLVSTESHGTCPFSAEATACEASAVKVSEPAEGCCPFMNKTSCDEAKTADSPCCHQKTEPAADKVASSGK
jgi:hypothetical protein